MEACGRLSRVWWKALPPDPLSSDTGSDCFRRAACAIRSGGSVARLPGHRAEHGRPRPEVSVSHGTPRKLQSFRRVPASSGEFRPVPPSSVEPVAFASFWICAELQGSSPSKALRRLLVEGLSSSKALRRILVKGLPPNRALGPGRSPVGWKHPPDVRFAAHWVGCIHQTPGSRPIRWSASTRHPVRGPFGGLQLDQTSESTRFRTRFLVDAYSGNAASTGSLSKFPERPEEAFADRVRWKL